MIHNHWVRFAQLFGIALRGLRKRAQIVLRIGAVVTTIVAEEVLRRFFAPIIDIILAGDRTIVLVAGLALGVLLYLRRRRA